MAGGRLAGRIALVTGASRGIGRAVALRFAAEGAHLILLARTTGGLEETDDLVRAAAPDRRGATLVPLDLADAAAIEALAPAIAGRFGRLDVLVGNAAILGAATPTGHLDPAIWDRVMAVNVTANWRLVRALEPQLRAGPAGRAIFVTSGAARAVFPYFGAYAASKAALEMMVRVWAAETTKTTLRVNMVDPGVVATALRAQAFPGEDPRTLPAPETVAAAFVDLAAATESRHGETVLLDR
ncbi:MAG: SDR family NAD(P)-dependent oxidoreductase [Alphaproteobacteria bacterium]|nr:SDR family NAD(P)-dependent oxidoreductase [Alphaproteobacteria bacterium]